MIIGIGTDIIEVKRFVPWVNFSHKQLQKIFHPTEIEYSLSVQPLAAQRLAVRFAAKEAFFKALYPFLKDPQSKLLQVARFITVIRAPQGFSCIEVQWDKIPVARQDKETQSFKVHASLSHVHELALATIVIESL